MFKRKNKNGSIREHLMTGVSYMIPIVTSGGVLIALAIAFSGIEAGEGAVITNSFLQMMNEIGGYAFALMVPVLAGFTAFSIADRPGIAPGLVGGYIANELGTGFLGGIVAGLLAGYIAAWIKSWKVPSSLKTVMPILIIPVLSTLAVGGVMYLISAPISSFMDWMTEGLKSMSTGNSVILGLILGAMVAFDMGGPVNKVAFTFGVTMIAQGVPQIMGSVAAAISVPPLGMGLASILKPKKYTKAEQEAGKGALVMGLIGITEGAIPFAAGDPLRVIPSIMGGSAVAAAIAAAGKVADYAPHGGPIVLPVVENKIMFIIAIVVGTLITALLANLLKKDVVEEINTEIESDDEEIIIEM